MTDHKYNDKENHSSDALSAHASHLVDYGSDNSGCKAKCQQTGVGKYITEPACNVVQVISTQCNAKSRILAGTTGEQYDSNCTQDRAPFCCCIESCGNTICFPAMPANMLDGIRIPISPRSSMYQNTTSQIKSIYL